MIDENIFSVVESTIQSGATPTEGMSAVLAFCKATAPQAAWRRIQDLPIEKDIAHMERWLSRVLTTEPPPSIVNGLWFGLFEPVLEDGTSSLDLYVAGSDHYDPIETEWHDWAVSPVYWPDGRYSSSAVLHGIKVATYMEPELPYDLSDYALSLAYSGLFVSSFARHQPRLLLGQASTRALVVGHDSGDRITIGTVDGGGLRAHGA